jgi:hypothetical protein
VRPPLEFLIEILRGAIIKQFKKKRNLIQKSWNLNLEDDECQSLL